MAGKLNKFLKNIGFAEDEEFDDEDEFEFEDDYEDQVEEQAPVHSFGKSKKAPSRANVVSLPTAAQQKVIIYCPIGYEDTKSIIDNFKSRKPVIVNMAEMAESDVQTAQRIIDCIAGAIYALGGTLKKVETGIYLMAPINCEVVGNGPAQPDDMP